MMLLPKWITRCTYMKDDYIGAGLCDLYVGGTKVPNELEK